MDSSRKSRRGAGRWAPAGAFTLVELVVATAIMGILATAAVGLIQTTLAIQIESDSKEDLFREGYLALEEMTTGVSECTFLHVPNSHAATRDILAFSGSINDDNDYYFGDTLFPRTDEDTHNRLTDDGRSGIKGIDDEGDGHVDGESKDDDDEDGNKMEDKIDLVDNDGDGNIDEDPKQDMNDDGEPGIALMDDDGDGSVDEQDNKDDDEDGSENEDSCNPIVYYLDTGTDTLKKYLAPSGAPEIVCTHVTGFSVTYTGYSSTRDPYVTVSLTLTSDDAKTITLAEIVYPENIMQRCGKRVR